MPESWDRQPNETARAYEAFRVFLDLGPERSTHDAFRHWSGTKAALQPSGIFKGWVKDHKWRARALAHDHHTAAVAQRAADRVTEQAAEKWAKRKDQQAEADYAFSQKYAGEVARRLNSPTLAEMSVRDLKDTVAVTAAASQLAWAAIQSQLPDPDADFNPITATDEELRAFLDRAGRRSFPRVAAAS